MSRKIFKTGHSLAVTLSKKILAELGLEEGDSVVVELDKGREQITVKLQNLDHQLSLDLHGRYKLGAKPAKK